ncbi:MAG: hypothetical protein ACI88H_004300 [Cocleimonas sp.]|jgi:hypothetical protein
MKKFLSSCFQIDEEKPLHENPSFWFAILIFPLIGLVFAIGPIIYNVGSFCFSAQCYKYFVSTFSFPIWISSGSLLLGIMVGRFHGSKQRSAKLSLDIREESFKRYFEHRDYIKKFADKVLDIHSNWMDRFVNNAEFDLNKFYQMIYPDNSPNKGFNYSVPKPLGEIIYPILNDVKKQLEALDKCVKASSQTERKSRIDICASCLCNIYEHFFIFSNEPIGLNYSYMYGKDVLLDEGLVLHSKVSVDDLRHFVCHVLLDGIIDILKFCEVQGDFESAREEVEALNRQFDLDRNSIHTALMLVYSEPVY